MKIRYFRPLKIVQKKYNFNYKTKKKIITLRNA